MMVRSMEISNVETLFPGAVTFDVDNIPESPDDWVAELPYMTSKYLGETGLEFMRVGGRGGARTSIRSFDAPMPFSANDLYPHKDLTPTGTLIGTVVTGIVCVETSGIVPGLELIDTVALLEDLKARKVFEKYGVDQNDLDQYLTLLSYDSFFSRTLKKSVPRLIEAGVDGAQLDEVTSKIKPEPQNGVFDDIVEMPLIEINPFSGAAGLCVEAERFIGIKHAKTGRLLPQELVDEIIMNVEGGASPGVAHTLSYEQGKAILFGRDGSIHKALPGECHRVIHIGRIATNPRAHDMKMAALNPASS